MIVTLIGYRGCGKSSVGRLLAKQLSWESIDADIELESRAGQTIQQIFATGGELEFRNQEEKVIADLLKSDHLVLAAGGGAVLRESTRKRMQAAGPVVWLTASPETLYERIRNDAITAGRRPALTDQGGLEEVRQLLAKREVIYRESCSLAIDTEQKSLNEIVDELQCELRRLEGFGT